MARFIFTGFLLLTLYQGCSQQTGIYPIPFIKFTDNYTFDNPAAAVLSESWEIKMVNSFYTGFLENVGFYFLDASVRFNKNNPNRHIPGIMLYSEYETEILKRTRAYGRYVWSTSLSSSLTLSAGIHVGIFNYSVKSTSASPGAASIVPDASLGLWLKGEKLNIGISSAQIPGAEVKPVNATFRLSRYFILTSDYRATITPDITLLIAGKIWKGHGDNQGIHPAAKVVVAKNFSAEINYLFFRGTGFSLGVQEFPVLKIHGNLHFSYFQPVGSLNPFNAQRFEVYLKLHK